MAVIGQVELEDVTGLDEGDLRILLFDPTDVYKKIYSDTTTEKQSFSHYKRRNQINMSVIFPDNVDKTCACGCGRKLTGRRRRWFSDECSRFAFTVHQIISGDVNTIRHTLTRILGEESCNACGVKDSDIPRRMFRPEDETDLSKRLKLWNKEIKEMANKIHVEHIVPVHKGGGGCWLSNYQFLCESCHKEKTKRDKKTF